MSASYKGLWKLLIDKNMKKCDLLTTAGISSNILAKLGKNENVSMETLERICRSLGCDIGDILSFQEQGEAEE